ncbi:MAG TPA: sortase, partial [Candidatus Dojkabacteria bacterium]|nr:sortase [Candidatus Dojkabacteria bacterium]
IEIFKKVCLILILLLLIVLLLPFTPYITKRLNWHSNSVPKSQASGNSGEESNMVLHIPSIGLMTDVETVKGNSLFTPWKIAYSSYPDGKGNMVLAGHSYTYANPFDPSFFFLDQLSIQDGIEVLWKKRKYRYEVYDIFIVKPSEVDVQKNRFENEITLYTCYPKFVGDKRLIIKAKLVSIE